MFALVRDLAAGRDVSEIAVDPELAQRHLLAPLAARHGAAGFRDDLVRSTVAWGATAVALPPVVAALVKAGVRVAAIKGVAYATALYETPAERPMTDVDLLVPDRSFAAASSILGELGFVREPVIPHHHATTWVRDSLVIDLHRNIVGLGRSRIDLDAVWQRTVAGWPDGASRLDPSDELVFHLVHMTRNRLCGPLIQVVDAARLLARLSEASISIAIARGHEWGLAVPVELALRFCRELLAGARHPGGWLGPSADDVLRVRQPSTVRKIVFDLATAGSPSQLAARAVAYARSRL